MRNRLLFALAAAGALAGVAAAIVFSRQKPAEPPAFNPAPNPYARGIYANGIIESFQTNGENINVYPEASGTVTRILVSEGQSVAQGTPMVEIDSSVERAQLEQQEAQAEAAKAQLTALRAQPRPEVLAVSAAQVKASEAALRNVQDQLAKQLRSYRLNPKSVSKDALDNAINAVKIANTNLQVTRRQYELTRAGAWVFDIENQEKQYQALSKAAEASRANLEHFTIAAPVDGVVLSVRTAVGSYVSPQGTYSTYTQGMSPILVMGGPENVLQVRCYVDEILVHRLPDPSQLAARMFIRGTNLSVPLEYVRTQPYVVPKIQLSDQRTERVDVRVLPLIFKFDKPKGFNVYPGQLVDVYVGASGGEPENKKLSQLPGKQGG